MSETLAIDWIACDGRGLCAELLPERIREDEWGYPVLSAEPLPADHPLWSAPGLLISPHVGGNTSAFLPRAQRLVRAQVARFVAGQPLENVIAGSPSTAESTQAAAGA